jgi:hypothetical protein
MNEWRLDDSLNEMHDLFLATCVMSQSGHAATV